MADPAAPRPRGAWKRLSARLGRRSPKSLHQGYLFIALVLGALILTSALFVTYRVNRVHQETGHNGLFRQEVQGLLQQLRDHLWQTNFHLYNYLLAPNPVTREQIRHHARLTRELAGRLAALATRQDATREHLPPLPTTTLRERLQALQQELDRLIALRNRPTALYPALDMIDKRLGPAYQDVVAELQALQAQTEDARLRESLRAADEDWHRMISAFRLYLLRQTGLYERSPEGLEAALHDVLLLFQSTRERLQRLRTRPDPVLREEIKRTLGRIDDWFRAFRRIRRLQQNNVWRTDFDFLVNRVQPLYQEIWQETDRIEEHLKLSADNDVTRWAELTTSLYQNIAILSFLTLGLVLFGYHHFRQTILRPLGQLTRAMYAVARGDEEIERLPEASTMETRQLTDAFRHMRQQILIRQEALRYQSLHDALTGLPNRTLLTDRLQQTLYHAQRENEEFCLLILDLDRFKEINDTLGHQAGDDVLREIAHRLALLLRRSDTVARLGGDEFAILLPSTGSREAEEIAAKIAEAVEQPIRWHEQLLYVGTSIGIAAYPAHGHDVDTLLKRADVAMYVAKNNDLPYAVYNVRKDQHSISRLTLISELRRAIETGSLELHYQPKIAIEDRTVVGAEALLRWPKWHNLSTESLIQTCEQAGLIQPLTQWVLEAAVDQLKRWQGMGLELPVAVNLSAWNLAHSEIDTYLDGLIQRQQISPGLLEVEITENSMMRNPERAVRLLRRLKGLGIRLAVDDFGTGFSSLTYLKRMPVDHIKIDKSFVMDMLQDENDAIIVRSIIDLAHNLGMKVIAEGVDSSEVFALLEILRCDMAQGYFISRPLPPEGFNRWLARQAQAMADTPEPRQLLVFPLRRE
ncbi:MAG: EAL domain-containing protein [Gammaproteobacteria bacterium]|nr:MAG: EAL domain-containing protein [Gammaproteobacteria bacterium]